MIVSAALLAGALSASGADGQPTKFKNTCYKETKDKPL
jgi:hypothetical protein